MYWRLKIKRVSKKLNNNNNSFDYHLLNDYNYTLKEDLKKNAKIN